MNFRVFHVKIQDFRKGITLVTEEIKEVIGIEIKDPKLIETFFDDEYPFYHYVFRVENTLDHQ